MDAAFSIGPVLCETPLLSATLPFGCVCGATCRVLRMCITHAIRAQRVRSRSRSPPLARENIQLAAEPGWMDEWKPDTAGTAAWTVPCAEPPFPASFRLAATMRLIRARIGCGAFPAPSCMLPSCGAKVIAKVDRPYRRAKPAPVATPNVCTYRANRVDTVGMGRA